eukprot:gene29846-13133_t
MKKHLGVGQQQLFLSAHPDTTKFDKSHFDAIMERTVDKIVYGPNAPRGWTDEMLAAWRLDSRDDMDDKVIIVLNFFGKEYRPEHALAGQGDASMELLHSWDAGKGEHYTEYYTKVEQFGEGRGREFRKVYYPSLKSISDRIARLRELRSCGLGVYNLGTGLEYFYDLI